MLHVGDGAGGGVHVRSSGAGDLRDPELDLALLIPPLLLRISVLSLSID